MRMTLILVYFTALSILQIFYVAGVSVSWSSPGTIYSSISSKSVPTNNGNLQQESTSSTIQPFGISEGTLTSQIDNLNTKMSSNKGLGQNSNMILVKQVGQRSDNNDASVSENIITNTQPTEMSSESSQSSTIIPNFKIPDYINGPGLSNIYHGTNKIGETNYLNEANNLEQSSGSDEGFQLGEFGRLSESIIDSTGELNERNGKGLSKEYGSGTGETETLKVGNYRGGHKSRKINLVNGTGFEAGKGAKQGFIGEGETKEFGELSRDGGGRMFIGNGEDNEEGRDRGFGASVGPIQFGRKNYGRAGESGGKGGGDRGFSRSDRSIRFGRKKTSGSGGSSGEERGDRGISRSNGFIRFSRKNKNGTGGLGGEKEGDIGVGRSNGSIRFGRKRKGREGESGGEEKEGRGFSGSVGSIRLGRKNKSGTVGSSVEEPGDGRLSKSNGSIRFSRKNKSGTGRLGEEEEDVGVGRSNGSMQFGRAGGSGGEEEEGREFSGSAESIRLGSKNKSESGGENIKFGEGRRDHRTSISRGVGKMNGSGGKRTFGESVGSITFGEESGDTVPSKSNSININRTVGNYGGRRFDGYIKGNEFSKEYGTDEENDGGAFGEFRPEMGEKPNWVD